MGAKCKVVFCSTALILIVTFITTFILLHGLRHRHSMNQCENSEGLLYVDGSDEDNGTCYPSGSQGPCQPNMILLPHFSNSSLGVCQCDNINNQRTLIQHKKTNQCYFVFTQGDCEAGEWLRLTREGPKCEPNRCLTNLKNVTQMDRKDYELAGAWVPLIDGSCAQLGQWHKSCQHKNQVIRFFRHKLYPACNYNNKVYNNKMVLGGVGVPPAECLEGHSRTQLGHCATNFDYD